MEYKIGVIGDTESVIGFLALGFSVFPVKNAEEAGRELQRRAKEDYAILFVVEDYARDISDLIGLYKDSPLPAVIVIPGKKGTTGYGLANIKRSVERAVGADILFKDS